MLQPSRVKWRKAQRGRRKGKASNNTEVILGDFGLTITKADLGPKKGVFYRLRVGPFVNEVSARAFCKKLSKRKMGCLVIKPDR